MERTAGAELAGLRSDSSVVPRPGRKIALFADGANLEDILAVYRAGAVQGFTTNPTLMWQAGVTDYVAFAHEVSAAIKDLPISFEVFADDFAGMERQARLIASWGDNVFVKIPVTNTRGDSSRGVVRRLSSTGVRVNVTAMLTMDQVREMCEVLDPKVPSILSLFAGRIADTGRDPEPVMREAVRTVSRLPLAKVCWASPREVLNVYQAEACGCHIVTCTKALLDKLALRDKDLAEFSRETVEMFFRDAQRAGYTL
jgi:transaldolase